MPSYSGTFTLSAQMQAQAAGIWPAAPAGAGQQAYTTSGSYSWIAPAGVTSISFVLVSKGDNRSADGIFSGAGGCLGYKNNVTVVPGASYVVTVGAQATSAVTSIVVSGTTYSVSTPLTRINMDGGGNGGASNGSTPYPPNQTGGPGAGGYSGNGGGCGAGPTNTSGGAGTGGAGGGGGGGSDTCGGGGGVGILGQGSNGAGGTSSGPGGGGSGGAAGSGPNGGLYGGGAGSGASGLPGGGAARIIWAGISGITRAFPSTNTGNL